MTKLNTSRIREFGVQSQYLDGELHLVNNPLAGTVAGAEKFQVGERVILPVAVDVVDSLFGQQFPSERLRHDVTMFHDKFPAGSSESRNSDPSVAVSFYVRLVISAFEAIQRLCRLVVYFALLIAEFLLCVYSTARLAASALYFSARETSEGVFLFGRFFSACCRAWDRAVKLLVSVLFFVGVRVRFGHLKFFSAFFAGKKDDSLGGRWRFESMTTAASYAAELLVHAWIGVKQVSTIQARFLKRHGSAPLFVTNNSLLLSLGIVK